MANIAVENKKKNPNHLRKIGSALALGLTALSGCGLSSQSHETKAKAAHVAQPKHKAESIPTTTTTEANVALTNAEKLVSDAVERLKRVGPVEGLIGGIIFPKLQREGATVSIDPSQIDKVGDGPTATPVDQLVADSPPQVDTNNPIVTQYVQGLQKTQPNYMTRSERHNPNYSYPANHWLPIYGHLSGTPMPGEVGNSLFFEHDITESAAGTELDALQKGDSIIIFNVDSATNATSFSVFTVLGTEIHSASDGLGIENYENADYASTATFYFCWPQGQKDQRMVIRAGQLNSVNNQNSPDLVSTE